MDEEDYSGYKDIIMSEEEMAYFYEHPYENIYGLEINEYLIIRNSESEIVSQLCWTGDGYRHITYTNLDSNFFGRIKAINGDPYQILAIDSLVNNKITMLKGKSGSGKSFLALGYLFHELEKGHINEIIIFVIRLPQEMPLSWVSILEIKKPSCQIRRLVICCPANLEASLRQKN